MTSKRCEKLFRDPVHNVIHFNQNDPIEGLLVRLIDSRPVQRLRHIKQLGLASFVYHGAEHTRFGHSLGTTHMARRLYQAANRSHNDDPWDRLVCLCAALLHDLGHAPFSHAFETSLEGIYPFKHEKFSEAIILCEQCDVHNLLAEHDPALPQAVADCIGHRSQRWFDPIISSQLDADRMDYILRDGFMTGVKNYLYDSDRIIEMLDRDEQGPLVGARAIQAVESYLLSRFHMYQQVYHHKTVRGGEKLVEAMFRRIAHNYAAGNDEALHCGALGVLLRSFLEQSDFDTRVFLSINDNHAWVAIDTWSQSRDPLLSDLAQRLKRRKFFKTIEIPNDHIPLFHQYLPELNAIAENAGFDPTYYVQLDSTRNRAFAPYAPPISLPLFPVDNAPQPFDDIRIQTDDTVQSIQDSSPIVQMLTTVSSDIKRCCVPEEIRGATLQFLRQKRVLKR